MNISRREWLAASVVGSIASITRGDQPRTKQAPVTAIEFAPDGGTILAASQAGLSLRNADADVSKPGRFITVGVENIHQVRFSPDHQTLVVCGGSPADTGVVEFFDWPNGKRRSRIAYHYDVIYGFDFAPDGSRWVVASGDEACSVFAASEQKRQLRYTEHSRAVLAAVFLAESKTVVSGSRDQTLRVWNADTGENLRTLHNHSGDVHALALKPSADTAGLPMVASCSADLTIRFWQPTIGRMVRFIRLPSEPLCIAWFNGGERLIAGCRDGRARIIDPVSVTELETIQVSNEWIHCVAVDPKGERAALGTHDGEVVVIELPR